MTQFNSRRHLTDYNKVQVIIGNLVRNKKFLIKKEKINNKKYLDTGCGPNTHSNFVNLDYHWTPKIDICWDFTKKKLPFPDNYFEGIFTEHCLEHISFKQCEEGLKEFYRVLKPDGILRIIVPDGELYFDIYQKKKVGDAIKLPYEDLYMTPMARINGLFRENGHLFIYDFLSMKTLLEKAGFKKLKKLEFRVGNNKDLLLDTEIRKIESLYIEAYK